MSTAVCLVVGADGATQKGSTSGGVSSRPDRAIFLERRRHVDVIIIGGNTARSEPYAKTPAPLVVITRSLINPLPNNPQAHIWNTSPALAIERARNEFGPNILIEAGPSIIFELLDANLIDQLYLSVTTVQNGENVIDWEGILERFNHIEKNEIEGTRFYFAHN